MAECLARVLVTGGQGFLGAFVLKQLLEKGSTVALLDLKDSPGILEQVLEPEAMSKVQKVFVDIADAKAVKQVTLDFKPTAVIHLAGVQIPAIKANPALGVAVNVLGTVNIFEAVKELAAAEGKPPVPVCYASSGAVLGPSSDYAFGGPLPSERDYHKPRTMYGVFKLCNEGTARIYWQDFSIPSVALRPLTIFGVGRETGLTSGPTKAVKAAVLGRRFVIEVAGTTGFHYVADVAQLFIDAVAGLPRLPGAHVCGIRGHIASYEDFLQEAAKSVPELKELSSIKQGAPHVPIHGDVDEAPLQALTGRTHLHRSLAEAVADMASHFRKLHQNGRLHDKDLGPEPPKQAPTSKL